MRELIARDGRVYPPPRYLGVNFLFSACSKLEFASNYSKHSTCSQRFLRIELKGRAGSKRTKEQVNKRLGECRVLALGWTTISLCPKAG